MDNSDSDAFESAEEFVSADEDDVPASLNVENSSKAVILEENVKTDLSSPTDLELRESDYSNETEDISTASDRKYRKRPERTKRTDPPQQSKPELKQVIEIVKNHRPDELIKGITNQLTSNITKGLSAFQEKSTTIKDLVIRKTSEERTSDEVRFVYDSVRSDAEEPVDTGGEPLTSLNNEIEKLSLAFQKFNEANANTTVSNDNSSIHRDLLKDTYCNKNTAESENVEYIRVGSSENVEAGTTTDPAPTDEIITAARTSFTAVSGGTVRYDGIGTPETGEAETIADTVGLLADAAGSFNEVPDRKSQKDNSDGWDEWPIDTEEEAAVLPTAVARENKSQRRNSDGWDDCQIDAEDVASIPPTTIIASENQKVLTTAVSRSTEVPQCNIKSKKDISDGWDECQIDSEDVADVLPSSENPTVLTGVGGGKNSETEPAEQIATTGEEGRKRQKISDEPDIRIETERESPGQFPFMNIVAGVGKIVEAAKVQEIGSLVLSGGLETLETIGKKTMEVIQDVRSTQVTDCTVDSQKGDSDGWDECNIDAEDAADVIPSIATAHETQAVSTDTKIAPASLSSLELAEMEPINVTPAERTDYSASEVKQDVLDEENDWGDWGDDCDSEEQPLTVNLSGQNNVNTGIAKCERSDDDRLGGSKLQVNESADEGWGDWADDDNGDDNDNSKPSSESREGNLDKAPEDTKRIEETEMVGWDDWGDDNTEENNEVRDNKEEEWTGWDAFGQKKEPEWKGISSWGFNRLLSTATAVTSNISAVTQGISTVIETGLGVPDPETMARIHKTEEVQKRQNILDNPDLRIEAENETPGQFPFMNIVANVGKIVEVAKVQEIGSRVLSGGLDTLETIGKKTMEVLQDGDPGLKNKKALILGKGQVLSQVLREARDRAASEEKHRGEMAARRRCDFETLFDDFHGLVHLEALEMLSRQSQLRVEQILQSLPPAKVRELRDTMSEVEQLCEIDDDVEAVDEENFSSALEEAIEPLRNELSVTKIVQIHGEFYAWIKSIEERAQLPDDCYEKAMSTMAELTASAAQQFHKAGELLLLKERRKTVEEADSLLQFSSHICSGITNLAGRILTVLRNHNRGDKDTLINNLTVEATNATTYIKQAFELLVPVLQLGAI